MNTLADARTLLTTDSANAAVSAEVGSWEGVAIRRHSRGGIEFVLDRRNLGHLHDGTPGGAPGRAVAHLPLPRRERDGLIAAGRAHPHPVMPDSGWIGVEMGTPAGVAETIDLFRRTYERALRAREEGAMTTVAHTGLETVVPGLHASPPERLPFGRELDMRAYLLERARGNILIYRAATLAPEAGAIDALGGISRQYLNHSHEASPACDRVAERFGAPLIVHAAEADEVSRVCRVTYTFSRRHVLDEDFEVIPAPGHTPGATAYLWDSGAHRVLFTGDTIYLRDGEWIAAVLDGVSDRERYIESLELIRGLDFDLFVPGIAAAGEPHFAVTDPADRHTRVGTIIERLRSGGDR